MTIKELLHEIVRHLPHRQDTLNELHACVDQLDAPPPAPPDPRVIRMEELQAQIPGLVSALMTGAPGSKAALDAASAELEQLGAALQAPPAAAGA